MFAVMVHISQRVYFTSSYFTVEISATHLLKKVIMAFLFDNEIRYFPATPIHCMQLAGHANFVICPIRLIKYL